MSKIVFINPSFGKLIKPEGLGSSLTKAIKGKDYAHIPNLSGLIFAALTPEHHSFTYLDEEIETIDCGELDADLIAITAMSAQANHAYEMADQFRERGITVVMGGIHASVMSEEAALHCDAVAIGEGEHTWPAMLEDFESGTLKQFYNAKDFPPVTDLVSPRYDAFRYDQYYTFPIQATRGCPYNCDFCSVKHSSGHRYRMRPVEDVVNDIRQAERYNDGGKGGFERKTYFFVDDNLYVNREYSKKLFTAIADADLDIIWDGQGTVDTASDEEVVELMARSGCRSFSFGFESINTESLKEANKPKCNVVENYQTAIENLHKHGIASGGFFIVGFDMDDVDVFRKTLDFIKHFSLLQPFISLLTPFPGTELYERVKDEGRIFEEDWALYNSWACVYTPKRMSVEELQAGFHWLGKQVTSLDLTRNTLEKFWENGAWVGMPGLTMGERLLMFAIALVKLRGGQFKPYRKFLYWAARHPKAKSFSIIIWAMMRSELVEQFSEYDCYDPAERRAREQALAPAAATGQEPPIVAGQKPVAASVAQSAVTE
jgi:radical SAM superfamily enzyme YgiQ (UPF0313 family)